jgi:putative addiction module antidote
MCYIACMRRQVTLRRAGGSITATLPREMADRLRLSAGDRVFVVETDLGLLLTPYDESLDRALRLYERGARKYRDSLRELAR